MELKRWKIKNQETDGYGRYTRPKTEKRKRKENDNWKLEKKTETEKNVSCGLLTQNKKTRLKTQ